MPSRFSIVAFCSTWVVLLGCFAARVEGQLLGPISNVDGASQRAAMQAAAADAVPRSVGGQHIGSVTVDPLMTLEQEASILEQLWQVDDTSWQGWTFERLAQNLEKRLPVYLNEVEFDMMGVDPESRLGNDEPPAGRLAMRLMYALEPVEMTIMVRRGALEMTSRDAAEMQPLMRVYDVAVIDARALSHLPTRNRQLDDRDALMHHMQMHIDPNGWLAAGGTSAMTLVRTLNRQLLVVTAPSTTHWKVSKFLDVLNRSEVGRDGARWSSTAAADGPNRRTNPLNNLPHSRDRLPGRGGIDSLPLETNRNSMTQQLKTGGMF